MSDGGADGGPVNHLLVPHAGSRALLLIFSTITKINGSFWFYRNTVDLPINKLYLSDPYPAWFQRGVPSLGADLPATLAAIRGIAGDLGATAILCLGQSIGAYGAMLYGHRLKAARVLAFGCEARLLEPGSRSRKHLGGAQPVDTERFRELTAWNGGTSYDLVFGQEDAADLLGASQWHGTPGLVISEMRGVNHQVPSAMAPAQRAAFLADLLAGRRFDWAPYSTGSLHARGDLASRIAALARKGAKEALPGEWGELARLAPEESFFFSLRQVSPDVRAGRFGSAGEMLAKHRGLWAQSPELRRVAALVQRRRGEYRQAIDAAMSTINTATRGVEFQTRMLLGECHEHLREADSAIRFYEEALELAGAHAEKPAARILRCLDREIRRLRRRKTEFKDRLAIMKGRPPGGDGGHRPEQEAERASRPR